MWVWLDSVTSLLSKTHGSDLLFLYWGFSGRSDGKDACHAGDPDSVSGSGRSPGGWHGNPLQYSCLENPMDRGAWLATVLWGHKESDTTERLIFCTIQVIQANIINREAHNEDGNRNGNLEFRVSKECGDFQGHQAISVSGSHLQRAPSPKSAFNGRCSTHERLRVALLLRPREPGLLPQEEAP